MSRSTLFREDLELDQIRETEEQLRLKEKEFAEIPKRLAQEIKDRECTMPPLAEIMERKLRRQHEQIVSRGEVSNIQRVQTRSTLLLMLLLTATASLVWWGLKLMQG
ncbi:MAG: hypothetical protein ABI162_16860 [Luteolibacter sp.]